MKLHSKYCADLCANDDCNCICHKMNRVLHFNIRLLKQILRHAIKPTNKEFTMTQCWRVDRRIACYKCWYPYIEAFYATWWDYFKVSLILNF